MWRYNLQQHYIFGGRMCSCSHPFISTVQSLVMITNQVAFSTSVPRHSPPLLWATALCNADNNEDNAATRRQSPQSIQLRRFFKCRDMEMHPPTGLYIWLLKIHSTICSETLLKQTSCHQRNISPKHFSMFFSFVLALAGNSKNPN